MRMPLETPCPVDLEDGLARAGDDREFYRELLEIFLDDTASRLVELRTGLAAGDCEKLASDAHGIKGAAANLSATFVREAALAIERQGREGNLSNMEEMLQRLEGEVSRLAEFAGSF